MNVIGNNLLYRFALGIVMNSKNRAGQVYNHQQICNTDRGTSNNLVLMTSEFSPSSFSVDACFGSTIINIKLIIDLIHYSIICVIYHCLY